MIKNNVILSIKKVEFLNYFKTKKSWLRCGFF